MNLKSTSVTLLKEQYLQQRKSAISKLAVSFRLSFNEFKNLSSKDCFYCGAEPKRRRIGDRSIKITPLGRLRSDVGFTTGNTIPCCEVCMELKGDRTSSEFMELISNVYEHQNNGNDNDTLSVYRKERNVGMRGSAILQHIYDMSQVDNLQKADIKALLESLVDEHIIEYDELNNEYT